MGPLTAACKDIELFRTGETDESIQADVIAETTTKIDHCFGPGFMCCHISIGFHLL